MKKNAMLMSTGLDVDLSYSASSSIDVLFQDYLAVSENNTDGKNNSCGKLMQESLGCNKLQKSFIGLNFFYKKLKQESSYLRNFIQGDLILVGNIYLLLDRC